MSQFIQVALPLPIPKTFDYRVLEGLSVLPGCRVRVPFGKRKMTGVVVSVSDVSSVKGVKNMEALLDKEPVVAEKMLEFTRWIALYYLAGWGEVLPLACPPAVAQGFNSWVVVKDAAQLKAAAEKLSPAGPVPGNAYGTGGKTGSDAQGSQGRGAFPGRAQGGA